MSAADAFDPSLDDDDTSADDERELPELSPHVPRWYAPIDPGLIVLQVRADFLFEQESAAEEVANEARRAERRAWLDSVGGWPR